MCESTSTEAPRVATAQTTASAVSIRVGCTGRRRRISCIDSRRRSTDVSSSELEVDERRGRERNQHVDDQNEHRPAGADDDRRKTAFQIPPAKFQRAKVHEQSGGETKREDREHRFGVKRSGGGKEQSAVHHPRGMKALGTK